MRRRNAFTLIELLVVIAIIGILAAIIFPVYAQAKKSAYKSSDLSNMNALRTALQLYKADSGSYPPALLGYVGPYENGSSTNGRNVSNGNILPPNSIRDALFPKRVESLSIFRPALDRVADNLSGRPYDTGKIDSGSDDMVTSAGWPGQGFGQAGSPNQRYGSSDTSVFLQRADYSTGPCRVAKNYYYRISGYDVAPGPKSSGGRMETHYQPFWSGWTVPADPCSVQANENGDATDTTRQLGYSDPPETTVVTWNTFFRDYDANGAPLHQKQDLVLFLGGSARPMDSASVAASAWAVNP